MLRFEWKSAVSGGRWPAREASTHLSIALLVLLPLSCYVAAGVRALVVVIVDSPAPSQEFCWAIDKLVGDQFRTRQTFFRLVLLLELGVKIRSRVERAGVHSYSRVAEPQARVDTAEAVAEGRESGGQPGDGTGRAGATRRYTSDSKSDALQRNTLHWTASGRPRAVPTQPDSRKSEVSSSDGRVSEAALRVDPAARQLLIQRRIEAIVLPAHYRHSSTAKDDHTVKSAS